MPKVTYNLSRIICKREDLGKPVMSYSSGNKIDSVRYYAEKKRRKK